MSLPGQLWENYGASGWGPDGTQAFMEYDYGAIDRQNIRNDGLGRAFNHDASHDWDKQIQAQQISEPVRIPRNVRDVIDNSCKWTLYYTDEKILRNVGRAYAMDYELYGWYSIDHWLERLKKCSEITKQSNGERIF